MTANIRIAAIMKNEDQAIMEWVAYHHVVGLRDIWIYDHESSDNSSAILRTLEDFGFIKLIPWRCSTGSPQLAAYDHAVKNSLDNVDWLAFIDADEFLVPLQVDTVASAIERISSIRTDVVGIGIHWKTFGSSYNVKSDGRLVMERFTLCAPGNMTPNNCIKTIANPRFVKEAHIHSCEFSAGNYIDELGRNLQLRQRGMDDRVTHSIIQINHYMVKSREEFMKKRLRGNGNRNLTDPDKYDRFTEEYWNKFDINIEEDNAIKRFIPLTKQIMRTMPLL